MQQEDLINPDRPGLANGSQVIGPRHFQIETGVEQDTLGGGNSKVAPAHGSHPPALRHRRTAMSSASKPTATPT